MKLFFCGDEIGGVPGVFAGQFYAQIAMVHDVAVDADLRATVDINTSGAPFIAVRRVAERVDVVDGVAGDYSVACLVQCRNRRSALEADCVDADVVVVVDQIGGNRKPVHVAIHNYCFAGTQFQVMDLIGADRDIGDRRTVVSVHGDAVRIATVPAAVDRKSVV